MEPKRAKPKPAKPEVAKSFNVTQAWFDAYVRKQEEKYYRDVFIALALFACLFLSGLYAWNQLHEKSELVLKQVAALKEAEPQPLMSAPAPESLESSSRWGDEFDVLGQGRQNGSGGLDLRLKFYTRDRAPFFVPGSEPTLKLEPVPDNGEPATADKCPCGCGKTREKCDCPDCPDKRPADQSA